MQRNSFWEFGAQYCRDTHAYREGRIAFGDRQRSDTCPHLPAEPPDFNYDRYCWMTGWHDAAHSELLSLR